MAGAREFFPNGIWSQIFYFGDRLSRRVLHAPHMTKVFSRKFFVPTNVGIFVLKRRFRVSNTTTYRPICICIKGRKKGKEKRKALCLGDRVMPPLRLRNYKFWHLHPHTSEIYSCYFVFIAFFLSERDGVEGNVPFYFLLRNISSEVPAHRRLTWALRPQWRPTLL